MDAAYKNLLFVLVLFCALWSCKEPFFPDLELHNKNLLVVEGFIDVSAGARTKIKLSRTLNLMEAKTEPHELEATVTIEGENDVVYPVTEQGAGVYLSAPLSLSPSQKYRLRIRTKDGKEYVSAYVQPKITPEIEKVGWRLTNDGIEIYVDTKDPQNKTLYYQFEYEETWEILSPARSEYAYLKGNNSVVRRAEEETLQMLTCWGSFTQKDLILASTAQLSADALSFPLVLMPLQSEKTRVRYSILVKQHALTKEEFDFLQLIKKNTDAMGTLFDPQPSELIGNLTSVSTPEEAVIGYVGAYTGVSKRIFINKSELPVLHSPERCDVVEVMNQPDSLKKYLGTIGLTPTVAKPPIPIGTGIPTAFFATSALCTDCRLRGSHIKPDFWK